MDELLINIPLERMTGEEQEAGTEVRPAAKEENRSEGQSDERPECTE